MSKAEFSQAIRSKYKQREREIKIKGDITLKGPNIKREFLPSFIGNLQAGNVEINVDDDVFIFTGTPNNTTYNLVTIGYQNISLQVGSYKLSVIPLDGTQETISLRFDDVDVTSTTPTTFNVGSAGKTITTIKFLTYPTFNNSKYRIVLECVDNLFDMSNMNYHFGQLDVSITNYKDFKFSGYSNEGPSFTTTTNISLPPGKYKFSIDVTKNTYDNEMMVDLGIQPGATDRFMSVYIDPEANIYRDFEVAVLDNSVNNLYIKFVYKSGKQFDLEFTLKIEDVTPYSIDKNFIIGESGLTGTPQILDFKVDETSDIYYESMPFSEMLIDVDNTGGYFSDFTQNSITDKLNKDCYIDFYLNVDDTGWCRTWTMQFDSLKADNQKATLTFKPYCVSVLKMKQLYDIDLHFWNYSIMSMSELATYINANYGITLEQDNTTHGGAIITNKMGKNQVSDLLLDFAGGLANYEQGQILAILDNKRLRYKKNSVLGVTQEDITENELLEKPLITKEVLEGIVKRFNSIKTYSTNTYNFQKQFSSVFRDYTEALIISGEDFNLIDLDWEDITVTNATIRLSTTGNLDPSDAGAHYFILKIQGNQGDSYSVQVNANLPRADVVEKREEIYAKGKYETTDNFIKLDAYKFANTKYWERLVDNLEKKVKLKIKALPYLQVGDSITLQDEGNLVITEIHTTWQNGFIMEITAYKVNYNTQP